MDHKEMLGQQSGGVNVKGGSVAPEGDIVGRDKITQNITTLPVEKITALHQLPPPTADFTGRTDELKELLEAIGHASSADNSEGTRPHRLSGRMRPGPF